MSPHGVKTDKEIRNRATEAERNEDDKMVQNTRTEEF